MTAVMVRPHDAGHCRCPTRLSRITRVEIKPEEASVTPFNYRIPAFLCTLAASCVLFGFPPDGSAETSGHVEATGPSDCAAASTPDQKLDEDTIRRIEQGWITAEYRGNPKFLDCLLEADYRTSGKSGQVRTRQDVLDHVPLTTDMAKAIPALQTIVFIHGNSATAHSIMKTTDKSGNPKEVHFVDGYSFHDGRWFAYGGADF